MGGWPSRWTTLAFSEPQWVIVEGGTFFEETSSPAPESAPAPVSAPVPETAPTLESAPASHSAPVPESAPTLVSCFLAVGQPNQGIIRGRSPLIELMSARRADINSLALIFA